MGKTDSRIASRCGSSSFVEERILKAKALDPSSVVAIVGSDARRAGMAQVAAASGHLSFCMKNCPETIQTALSNIRKPSGW
jgi:phosphoribosylformylglycinamidine (FGAM) synthase-like enzyme